MDRKNFLKRAAMGTAAALTGRTLLKGNSSTYDKLMEQVGFNHLPNQALFSMKTVLHKANSRGHANHGWLNSHHTFSFANYYNPERVHFGALRVLNDDVVAAGRGFGQHPHDNMEIISIPLQGDLEHKDSMGNTTVIKQGDIQVMSAGTGVFHSEYNKNADQEVKFLQIWVFPNEKNVSPRYDQITLKAADSHNQFQQVISPNPEDAGMWIHQNAWFHLGNLETGKEATYGVKDKSNGVYAFVIEGTVNINGQDLEQRDGLGIWDTDTLTVKASSAAKVLLMEVPMNLN